MQLKRFVRVLQVARKKNKQLADQSTYSYTIFMSVILSNITTSLLYNNLAGDRYSDTSFSLQYCKNSLTKNIDFCQKKPNLAE